MHTLNDAACFVIKHTQYQVLCAKRVTIGCIVNGLLRCHYYGYDKTMSKIMPLSIILITNHGIKICNFMVFGTMTCVLSIKSDKHFYNLL